MQDIDDLPLEDADAKDLTLERRDQIVGSGRELLLHEAFSYWCMRAGV
jgi:hypothetical protein